MKMPSVHIMRLMQRPQLGRCRIDPEQRLSIEVADKLRNLTIEGKLKAVWFHVPNEGKRSWAVAKILKAMGLISGTSDNIFMWSTGSGVIELKVGKNDLTENQKSFFKWCEAQGVKHACCRTLAEVMEVLKNWGVV